MDRLLSNGMLLFFLHEGYQENSPVVYNGSVVNLRNLIIEPWYGISNNVICATSKASDQPAHTRSLIRAFAGRLCILLLLS